MKQVLIIEASIRGANLWSAYVAPGNVLYTPQSKRAGAKIIRDIKQHLTVDILDFRTTWYAPVVTDDRAEPKHVEMEVTFEETYKDTIPKDDSNTSEPTHEIYNPSTEQQYPVDEWPKEPFVVTVPEGVECPGEGDSHVPYNVNFPPGSQPIVDAMAAASDDIQTPHGLGTIYSKEEGKINMDYYCKNVPESEWPEEVKAEAKRLDQQLVEESNTAWSRLGNHK